MSLQLPKGTRDFLPEDKIVRDEIVAILKKNFEVFGFNPLETPALEMYETLASKYAGGAEILKETYTLEDNAQRKLGLRYDLTVPFARVIAMNPQLKMPFKRYQIDKVWRDGPIKLGRYREFWQCDVDVVGVSSMMADAEIIALASKLFADLNFKIKILYNNRKLLNSLLTAADIGKSDQEAVILSLDKLEKIGWDGVSKELQEKKIAKNQVGRLQELFEEASLEKLDNEVKDKEGIEEIKKLQQYLKELNVQDAELSISLARGLSYYTGTVFEVFLASGEIASSLAAGGRYDKMIGRLAGKKEDIPAVGISFGLDVIADARKIVKKESSRKSVVKVFIIPISTEQASLQLLAFLRNNNINSDIDLVGRGVSKNLNFANQYNIPFVIFVGDDELRKGKYKLRDMASGKEEEMSNKELVKKLTEKNG